MCARGVALGRNRWHQGQAWKNWEKLPKGCPQREGGDIQVAPRTQCQASGYTAIQRPREASKALEFYPGIGDLGVRVVQRVAADECREDVSLGSTWGPRLCVGPQGLPGTPWVPEGTSAALFTHQRESTDYKSFQPH